MRNQNPIAAQTPSLNSELQQQHAGQVTHEQDDTGRMVQIVTPAQLRHILDAEGIGYERPDHFANDDEWKVNDEQRLAYCGRLFRASEQA